MVNNKFNYHSLLENIKKILKKRKITVTELAKMTNLNRSYLSKILNYRKPASLHLFCLVCECLDLEIVLREQEDTYF